MSGIVRCPEIPAFTLFNYLFIYDVILTAFRIILIIIIICFYCAEITNDYNAQI